MKKVKKIKIFGLAAAILVMVLMVSSCGSSGKSGSSGSSATGAKVAIDSAKAVEKKIPAAEGGQLSLDTTEGGKMKIIFPQEALTNDTSLVMTPISSTPFDGKDLLVKGFALEEKGTGKGPEMKSPAMIIFNVKGTVPAEASVIKYHEDDGDYDVVPSRVTSQDGKSIVTATVSSFSKYGMKIISKNEKDNTGQKPEDFDWVIYVKDKYSYNSGQIKKSVTIDLKAVNTSGNIWGQYNGSLTALTTNDLTMPGGRKITAPATSKNPNLSFNVGFPLASLTPPDDDGQLASLTSGEEPDFVAYGDLSAKTQMTGTVSIPQGSASKKISNGGSVPFEIYIYGPRVKLQLSTTEGLMYFDGFIRGEGK